jgi:hypothetical protein
MSTNHHPNNTNENHDARISATLAGSSRAAEDFVNQLHRLIAHFAATERSRNIREGIARRRARITQTDTGGHHDQ